MTSEKLLEPWQWSQEQWRGIVGWPAAALAQPGDHRAAE